MKQVLMCLKAAAALFFGFMVFKNSAGDTQLFINIGVTIFALILFFLDLYDYNNPEKK